MLKIHKPFSKKLLRISITSICMVSGFLGMLLLNYTHELSHADSTSSTKTLETITYMQEMTPAICGNTPIGTSKQLIDIRKNDDDTNPRYWVTKMRDKNCWMTQNLDLDIPANGLSVDDTDLERDWNYTTNPTSPPVSTQHGGTPTGFSGSNPIASYDPGKKFCGNKSTDGCDLSVSKNNGHDAVGNYYTWGAATAATSTETSNNTASGSICPKGWQLPVRYASGEKKSVGTLLRSYGWQINSDNSSTLTGGTNYNILNEPFYITLSGYTNEKAYNRAGTDGYMWFANKSGSNSGYYLDLGSAVYLSATSSRFYGYVVRCVSRGDSSAPLPGEDNIKLTINPTISIDVTDEIVVEKSDINPSTAAFSALVASNQPYSVSISSASPNMTSSTSDVVIPSKSGTLTSSENAWGIKLSTASTYEQITTTPKLFYSSTSPESKSLPFIIGISTAPDIPNGEYSTNITITATQN